MSERKLVRGRAYKSRPHNQPYNGGLPTLLPYQPGITGSGFKPNQFANQMVNRSLRFKLLACLENDQFLYPEFFEVLQTHFISYVDHRSSLSQIAVISLMSASK